MSAASAAFVLVEFKYKYISPVNPKYLTQCKSKQNNYILIKKQKAHNLNLTKCTPIKFSNANSTIINIIVNTLNILLNWKIIIRSIN